MPIRFQCRQCKKKLKSGSAKSGKRVICPTCGALNKVPAPPLPTAEEDTPDVETPPAHTEVAPPEPVDPPAPTYTEVASPEPVESLANVTPTEPAQPQVLIDPDLVAIPRVVLYIQGILIAAVGLVGFIAGYWIAGGDRPPAENPAPVIEQADQPVSIEGILSFQAADGSMKPDAGAVMVVFPQGRFPDERVPIDGLHPKDPPPAADHTPLLAIDSLGGIYLRTQADGSFSLVVPKPGQYHVLKISNNSQRPAGEAVSAADLDLLGRFFLPAPDLLGNQKYTWDTLELSPGTSLTHDFGISGK